MSLRDYQQLAVDQIREQFAIGNKRVLLKLSTGGGKTVIFCHMLTQAAERGIKSMMVVKGVQLVEQASRRLFREGVSHGVRQGNHWNKNYSAKIQICSVDTLIARGDRPPAQLIVIDEAHMATSNGYKKLLEHYPDAYIVAVTATPYTRESLEHLADVVVSPITMNELIARGYLVGAKYYAPSTPDLKGVRTQNGDYVSEQLEDRMNSLTGDIVNHWLRLSRDRPTLGFAVNIRHSESLTAQFIQKGIPAEHIEGMHTLVEREEAFARLARGDTKIIFNVGVACTGVDLPFLKTVLMARPTKSYSLYIQQCGRGTRPFEDKDHFLLLDHASNVLRHGLITDEPEVELKGVTKKPREQLAKICADCYAVYVGFKCHACGFEPPVAGGSTMIEHDEQGLLEELTGLPRAAEIAIFVKRSRELANKRGYPDNWVYYQVSAKFGDEAAHRLYPKKKRPIPRFLRAKR
jgi:DNA repair protein RadD